MKTLSYVLSSEEEIVINKEYYFGQLWDGNGDGENVVSFEVVKKANDILETIVRVTDMY